MEDNSSGFGVVGECLYVFVPWVIGKGSDISLVFTFTLCNSPLSIVL